MYHNTVNGLVNLFQDFISDIQNCIVQGFIIMGLWFKQQQL